MSKAFKIALTLIFTIVTVVSLYIFKDNIFHSFYQVEIQTTLSKGKRVDLDVSVPTPAWAILKPTQKLTSKIDKKGNAVFKISSSKLYQILFPKKFKKSFKKIFVIGDKKVNLSLNNSMKYNTSELQPKYKIIIHRLIVPILLLIWLIWGIWYVKPQITSLSPNTEHIMSLDFLRVLFTFIILIVHVFDSFKKFSLGAMGVEFFFILSGFLMNLRYQKNFTFISYLKKKIIRFWPLMIFIILFATLNFLTFSFSWFSHPILFMGRVFDDEKVYLGVTWYICSLFWVVLFYSYLIKIIPNKIVNVLIGIIVFFSYIMANRYAFSHKWENGYSIALLRGLAGIGLGYLLAHILPHHNTKYQKSDIKYTLAEGVLLPFIVSALFIKDIIGKRDIIVVVLLAILFILFVLRKGKISQFFDKNIWGRIGKYTLSVYLIHPVFIRFLKKLNIIWDVYSLSFWVTLLSIISAVILHHFIEIPTAQWLKKEVNQPKLPNG